MAIDTSKIETLDKSDVYGSIQKLSDQITQVVEDAEKWVFDDKYKTCSSIAISGMGGSVYSYYVLQSLFAKYVKKPLIIINGYDVPSQVSKDTLLISSSYSGTTEETILTTEKMIHAGSPVIVITAGGQLAEFVKKYDIPGYVFDPTYNPCGQPRVGLGYMIFGVVMILTKLGYMTFDEAVLREAVDILRNSDKVLQEKADAMIPHITDKLIVLVGAQHLAGAMHIARNQLNETAKTYAEYHLIPEMNHHLLEGLKYPTNKKMVFLFYNSPYYADRNKARFEITKKVLDKQNIEYHSITVDSNDTLSEFLQIMQINSYISFFLGLGYNVDPALIPWVDYFKSELQKL